MLSTKNWSCSGEPRDAQGHVSTSSGRRWWGNWPDGIDQRHLGRSRGAKRNLTYRRGMVCRLPETFTVVEDERSVLVVLVGRTVWLVLGMVVGEKPIGLGAGGRLKGVGLGVERRMSIAVEIRVEIGVKEVKGWSVYIAKLPGGGGLDAQGSFRAIT
jgi:hypothetical protein